ncbi:MAG TPA: glycosyltransferase [Geminicoccaceae bacterium]|nr:glycosyltransferase [Geminicoccus sp.]HMU51631.1 glycosyltransferase [Geminicoccaceae bacterium]
MDAIETDVDPMRTASRILLVSQRRLRDDVANACLYQLEDLLCSIDGVDILAPDRPVIMPGRLYKAARRGGVPAGLARRILRPRIPEPAHDYELMIAVLDSYRQVATVHQIREWRRRCGKAICFLAEIWPKDLVESNKLLELYGIFDHVFIGVDHGAERMAELAGAPCSHLHPAVDAIEACTPIGRPRGIDVCYIGRRSPVTHEALTDLARAEGLFYYHDTLLPPLRVGDHAGHRLLLANIIRSSRYFIANHAKIDRPDLTSGQQEVGYRFFEGVAGGAVLLGQPPRTPAFERMLPWPDAVIEVPFHAPDIAETIRLLDADPERTQRIRSRNMANALRMHDWVYRYEEMLAAVGVKGTPEMARRRARLAALADRIERQPAEAAANRLAALPA